MSSSKVIIYHLPDFGAGWNGVYAEPSTDVKGKTLGTFTWRSEQSTVGLPVGWVRIARLNLDHVHEPLNAVADAITDYFQDVSDNSEALDIARQLLEQIEATE